MSRTIGEEILRDVSYLGFGMPRPPSRQGRANRSRSTSVIESLPVMVGMNFGEESSQGENDDLHYLGSFAWCMSIYS